MTDDAKKTLAIGTAVIACTLWIGVNYLLPEPPLIITAEVYRPAKITDDVKILITHSEGTNYFYPVVGKRLRCTFLTKSMKLYNLSFKTNISDAQWTRVENQIFGDGSMATIDFPMNLWQSAFLRVEEAP